MGEDRFDAESHTTTCAARCYAGSVAATSALILALFGALVGAYGALVGAGGGFLIVPALLLSGLASAQQAAGTSLIAVVANAASGSVAAARHRRIDVRTGLWMALAAVPGSLWGAHLTVSGPRFEVVFGGLLLLIGGWLLVRPERAAPTAPATARWGQVHRHFVDAHGVTHDYVFSLPAAVVVSAAVGVLSSALGIGGGVILVPFLIQVLGVPAHVATGTSQLVLVVSSLLGAISHALLGHVLWGPALALAVGAVLGAQLGVYLASRLKGRVVVRLLSLALLATGLRLGLRGLGVG